MSPKATSWTSTADRTSGGQAAHPGTGGAPGETFGGSRFEFFRAMSGRRNPEQIAAYEWEGDAEPYIPYFYPYGIRKDPLIE